MPVRDYSGRMYGVYYDRSRRMEFSALAACMYRVLTRSAEAVTVPTGTDFTVLHDGVKTLVVEVRNLTDDFLYDGKVFSPQADAVIDSVERFVHAFNWTHPDNVDDCRFFFTVELLDEYEHHAREYPPGVVFSSALAD